MKRSEADLKGFYINVPAIPPSVNNYVRHSRSGIHYKTREAEAFAEMVVLAARENRDQKVEAVRVVIAVCLGPGNRGDIDNFPKVVLDSLVRCKAIRSDASIEKLVLVKTRGPKPKTEVWVNL